MGGKHVEFAVYDDKERRKCGLLAGAEKRKLELEGIFHEISVGTSRETGIGKRVDNRGGRDNQSLFGGATGDVLIGEEGILCVEIKQGPSTGREAIEESRKTYDQGVSQIQGESIKGRGTL